MIARRMRMNTPSKSSVTRLISYLTNTQGSSSRVGEVRVTGCESEDAGWAGMEMLAVQQQNIRAKGDKTYHLVVSFREGERPSSEALAEIEKHICEQLGYGEHQRLSVVHNDTENMHLHVAINKVHPEKLTIHEPLRDFRTLARACTELEKAFGLAPDNHISRTQARPTAAINMERAGDMESLIGWIQRNCLTEMKEAGNWDAFGKVLAEHGLSLKARGNGLVFMSGKVHVKASSVDRSLSRSNLEKRFGTFEGIAQSPTVPKKEYVRQPMSGNSPLWEAYRREDAERQKKREQMRQDRLEQRDDAVKDFRLRNLLIKNMTSGILNKIILYRLSRAKLKKKMQKEQWIDWNKTKARQQSSDSLSYLQTRNRLEHQAFLAGVEKLPFGRPEKVTGKGTRMYPGGIREQGGRILIPANPTEKELRHLLDFAERHFSRFTIHAPEGIRRRVLELSSARERARNQAREQSRGYSR